MTELFFETSIDEIVTKKVTRQGYYPVALTTDRGEIKLRYYHHTGVKKAVIFVGGSEGGFNSPAANLYPSLCKELTGHGISSLRVRFRNARDLVESVLDVIVAITFLERFGIEDIALVGYSFGGAVMLQAAAASPGSVSTVVTLATQSYGSEAATLLENVSLLLIHGEKDEILPSHTSTYVHDIATGEKQLLMYQNATHGLTEVSSHVKKEMLQWLIEKLNS